MSDDDAVAREGTMGNSQDARTASKLYFAVYVSDDTGPLDPDDGCCSTCVALFEDLEDALAEAITRLHDGFSVSIDRGAMPVAEWDALDEVPDDYSVRPPAVDAVGQPTIDHTFQRAPDRSSSS